MFAPFREILRAERERTVSGPVGVLRYLGALTLIGFFLEIATGVFLMVYYRPSAGAAYYSTGIIMDEVRLGWLVRSLHRWGADLLILFGFLHLTRVYFSRAYQVPRQLNWVIGILLLVLIIAMGLTGTLLPWDQYAYWYTDAARATLAGTPVLGSILLTLIWGGWEIGEEVLLRFYAFHVGVLPWLALSLLSLHVLLVWRMGIKEPARVEGTPQPLPTPFYPDFLVSLLIAVVLMGGLLVTLAVVFPPTLLEQADPLTPLSQAQPRWYLLPVRELLRDLPGGVAALTTIAFLLLLFLVPVLDRTTVQRGRRLVQRTLGILVIAAWVLVSVRGCLR